MGTEFDPTEAQAEADRIAKADKRYAMDYTARENGWATQGAADYCKRNGHATLTVDGVTQGYCPRCLDMTEQARHAHKPVATRAYKHSATREIPFMVEDVTDIPDYDPYAAQREAEMGMLKRNADDLAERQAQAEALDPQGVSEWLDTIEARVHRDFNSQAGVQAHKVIVPVCPLSFGQDHARGILAVNPYSEGSFEWHAWGLGYDYGVRTGGTLDPWTVLNGEWADSPTPWAIEGEVAHLSGFEREDLDPIDTDEICEAYEHGYDAYAKGWRV